jgi:hypothetical protein
MLFHEALHHVVATFSRQVLQQGRLAACLADCAVFDVFDDRRTICLTIDRLYGVRLYNCLSHSPYKAAYDAMVEEVKLLYPNIDPLQVEYVFQSVRYAWGKVKKVRPPKAPVLFAPPKKKKKHTTRKPSNKPLRKQPQRRTRQPLYHTKQPPSQAAQPQPQATPNNRSARVVLYLFAILFAFCACIMLNAHVIGMGIIFLLLTIVCAYAIYRLK